MRSIEGNDLAENLGRLADLTHFDTHSLPPPRNRSCSCLHNRGPPRTLLLRTLRSRPKYSHSLLVGPSCHRILILCLDLYTVRVLHHLIIIIHCRSRAPAEAVTRISEVVGRSSIPERAPRPVPMNQDASCVDSRQRSSWCPHSLRISPPRR